MTLDEQTRADFPILRRIVHGQPLVYLDSAASSQKPRQVLEAMQSYYEQTHANVHRSIHTLGEEATEVYEAARDAVRVFIGARFREEIIFTRGTTDGINIVARTLALTLEPGDEILVTEMEHHSNLIPWQMICRERGAVVKAVPVVGEGVLDQDAFGRLLSPRTRLVALAHVSNVLGTINPVTDMTRRAHEAGALVLLDGAQAAPHLALDVAAMGCDFYVFYDLPWRFEPGTPPIAEAVGLHAAVVYLDKLGMARVEAHERALCRIAMDALERIPGVTLYGPRNAELKGAVVAFNVEGIHPHDGAALLDERGIGVRAGHHCAQPLMRRLGIVGTLRASFSVYNTAAEIARLSEAVQSLRGAL